MTNEERPLLTLKDIRKAYGSQAVLEDVSLTLCRGELTAVVGVNGSGKSTLLRIAAGLTAASSGTRIMSPNANPPVIGYAPDRLPGLPFTVREYLRHMAAIDGIDREAADRAIGKWLDRLRLPIAGKHRMKHYSKGMLQKVNLVQALLRKPDLLLLDEPFGGLDPESREEVTRILEDSKRQGTAIAVASHDREWVGRLADRCVEIAEGRIVRDEKSSESRSKEREIVCLLPEIALRESFGHIAGLRGWSAEGETVRYRIEAEASDRLLRELLSAGASILEVTSARGTGE